MLVLGVDVVVHVAMLNENDLSDLRPSPSALDFMFNVLLDVCTSYMYTMNHRVLLMGFRYASTATSRCASLMLCVCGTDDLISVDEYTSAVCS